MGTALSQRHRLACSPLAPAEANALLASALTLRRAAAAGSLQPLLRAKNLALLCADDTQPSAQLFRRAATELGARVAHVAVTLGSCSAPQDVAHTARMLGRLYDAVECQDMDALLVADVAQEAGVPVYDGLAQSTHPTALLALQMGAAGSAADNRLRVLQAELLRTIG